MAKHIYDKDGNYKGKILSDEEHQRKNTPPADPDNFSFIDRFLAKKFGKETMFYVRMVVYTAFFIFACYMCYVLGYF